MHKTVGIVTLNQDTFTNPTLYSLLKRLNDLGIRVNLYCGYQQHLIPAELQYTSYHQLPTGLNLPRRPDNIIRYFSKFFGARASIKKHKIVHVFAVDPSGLIMAGRLKRSLQKIKINYFSFEIFFFDELKSHPKILAIKNKEVKYSQHTHAVLIQDEERKRLLQQENKFPVSTNWHLVPVSLARNENGTTNKKYKKSDFGFKDSDIVYVHSGSVGSWAGIDQIIEAVEKGLPENTYIFIHNKSKFNRNEELHRRLFALEESGANLILHDELFENYDEYCDFLSCFDYGITIYKPDDGIFTGKNIGEIGLASGKFSTYMMAGLPTLLSDCSTYERLLKDYAVGEIIKGEKDLSYHIRNHSLATCKKSDCELLYNNVLDPTKAIDAFIDTLT